MPRKKKTSLAREAPIPVGKQLRASARATLVNLPNTPSRRSSRTSASIPSYAPIPSNRSFQASQADQLKDEASTTVLTSRPRGRPPKAATTNNTATPKSSSTTTPVEAEPVKAGRGRPKKSTALVTALSLATNLTKLSSKRKRTDEALDAEQPVAKRRGRPPKDATATATPAEPRKQRAIRVQKDSKKDTKVESKTAKSTAEATTEKKPRKPRTAKNADKIITADDIEEELVEHQNNEGTQYWLMKAEPDTRIVNGIDVAFPIDKLAAAADPEPWDGVRNPVARNNMRAMRKGDLAFFYHSNCSIPAIVGAMRIVEEHSPDESAFDPNHPYFDQKSKREKPTWDCVKVEFVKKFENPITLKALKGDPKLVNMQISQKAYGRLSVQSVTPAQWFYVLKMAGEPEDVGVLPTTSGYEADTNGETDKEAVEDSVGIDDVDAAKMAAYGEPDESTDGDEENDGDDADTAPRPRVNGTTVLHATSGKHATGLDGADDVVDNVEDQL